MDEREQVMSTDETVGIRAKMLVEINSKEAGRAELEAEYGQCWSTDEMEQDYEVLGFAAPLIVVQRRSDGVKGSLLFKHQPRFYFRFQAHRP